MIGNIPKSSDRDNGHILFKAIILGIVRAVEYTATYGIPDVSGSDSDRRAEIIGWIKI